MAAGSQQIVDLVFELLDPMLGLLPCGCTIVAIILVRVERQQGDDKHCYNNDKRRAHVFRLQVDRRQAIAKRPLLRNLEIVFVAGLCRCSINCRSRPDVSPHG